MAASGFSQGCAMGLLTGLTSERKLAGIISLSGWLPLRKKMKAVSDDLSQSSSNATKCVIKMMSDHARNYPVFWGHGRLDNVVNYRLGEMSVSLLKDDLKMKNVTFKT